ITRSKATVFGPDPTRPATSSFPVDAAGRSKWLATPPAPGSFLNDPESFLLNREASFLNTPGTYYWQVTYIDCIADCYIEGPVRTLIVGPRATAGAAVPGLPQGRTAARLFGACIRIPDPLLGTPGRCNQRTSAPSISPDIGAGWPPTVLQARV